METLKKSVIEERIKKINEEGILEIETWTAYEPILKTENLPITEFYEVCYREHLTNKTVREWYHTEEEAYIRSQAISHLEPSVTFCSVQRFIDW